MSGFHDFAHCSTFQCISKSSPCTGFLCLRRSQNNVTLMAEESLGQMLAHYCAISLCCWNSHLLNMRYVTNVIFWVWVFLTSFWNILHWLQREIWFFLPLWLLEHGLHFDYGLTRHKLFVLFINVVRTSLVLEWQNSNSPPPHFSFYQCVKILNHRLVFFLPAEYVCVSLSSPALTFPLKTDV